MATGREATLFTFGYSNVRTTAPLGDLIHSNSIDLIVDVRLKRYSGLRPFSTGTAQTFEAIPDVEYAWEPKLGNRLYKTDDIEIADIGALEGAVIKPLLEGRNVALMCGCADWTTCHRRFLADRVAERIQDLTPPIHL